MRTQDISNIVAPDRPNTGGLPMQAAPISQPIPQQTMVNTGGFSQSGPMQSGPMQSMQPPAPTGQFPQTGGFAQSGPLPQQNQGMPPQFPSTQQGTSSNSKKPWLIVGAVAVVVLVLVGVLIAVNSGSKDNNTAGGGGGGGGTTSTTTSVSGGGGGGGGGSTDCSDTSTDDKGFTPCMTTLAGDVPASASCRKGMFLNGVDESSMISAAKAEASTCDLTDKHSLVYLQFPSASMADQMVEGFKQGAGQQDLQPVDWSGGGYTGQYWVVEFSGVGALLYTVKDQPLAGFVMNLDSTNTTGSSLGDYFDQKIKPGH